MALDIFNRISVLIKKTYYINKRYHVDATFGLLYHEEPINVVELSEYVRTSDQYMPIDDHHYFIIFAFTTEENAFKASQNIIRNLDNHFNNQTSCIALDTFDTSNSAHSVINRLQQILTEIRKKPYSRVETEDILDH